MRAVRIRPDGCYEMTVGDLWEECSLEEFEELLQAGYELVDYEDTVLLES